jgi:hypothetical protein
MRTSATSGSPSRGKPPGPHLRPDRRSGRSARAGTCRPTHVSALVSGRTRPHLAPHGTALVPRRSRARCGRGEARCAACGLRCNAGASGKQKLGAVRLRAALKPLAGAAAKSTCISYQARRRDSCASVAFRAAYRAMRHGVGIYRECSRGNAAVVLAAVVLRAGSSLQRGAQWSEWCGVGATECHGVASSSSCCTECVVAGLQRGVLACCVLRHLQRQRRCTV